MNRLGQHFLTNADVLRKIARIIVRDGGPIIEIGPGHGELTKILLASPDIPRLIAIERDPALATALEKTFETESRFTL
ncbi:MAG: rRNA adenine N-6-methyltransferase family protein, partial [Patescibacteria group bacterium]